MALSALASFMAITLPLVPSGAIPAVKARKAAEVLVAVLARDGEGFGVSGARAAIKSLGVLIGFCDLEDWDSIKLGFETLLMFSIDKRPKVTFKHNLCFFVFNLYPICIDVRLTK